MLGRSRHIFETGDHPHPGEASCRTMGLRSMHDIHVIDAQPRLGTSS